MGIFPKMKSFLKNLTLLVLTLQSLQFHVKFQKNPIIFEKKALLTTPLVVLVVVLVVLLLLLPVRLPVPLLVRLPVPVPVPLALH